ncbi:MAG: GNAT family N-acetyltransferase [Rhodanobacter sp.]|jgi:RimJ/RimL family protein N-acetyltransferase|nr:GNAT family N-acetyltransferase [Rhodanobacter sp.]
MIPVAEALPHTELVDGPLCLRPWREQDAAMLCEAINDSLDSLTPWLPWCRNGYTLAHAADWVADCQRAWRSGERYAFAILDEDGGLHGGIGLDQLNRPAHSANLGYWVCQSKQRKGTATCAIGMIADFGFRVLELQRIEILAAVENQASRRCAEKAGACFSGIVPNRLPDGDQLLPAALYSLLPAESDAEIAAAPVLEYGPLRLRPFHPRDLDALLASLQESLDSIGRWEEWCSPSYSAADGLQWIAHTRRSWRGVGDDCALAIVDRASDALIGSISINQWRPEFRTANLGYWVRQSRQGQGAATLAVRMLATYALRTPALQRLEIVIAEANHTSRRVAENAGAQFEGLARCRLLQKGEPQTAAIYALTAADMAGPGAWPEQVNGTGEA